MLEWGLRAEHVLKLEMKLVRHIECLLQGGCSGTWPAIYVLEDVKRIEALAFRGDASIGLVIETHIVATKSVRGAASHRNEVNTGH